MRRPGLPLTRARIRNFKAIRDSGEVRFTPLTVFIGNNGSGKSSLVEALEALQTMAVQGLDEAFLSWRGFENVLNKAVTHDPKEDQLGRRASANPLGLEIEGTRGNYPFHGVLEVAPDPAGNRVVFTKEDTTPSPSSRPVGEASTQIRSIQWREFVQGWQFLNLNPLSMLYPQLQRRSQDRIRLARDGSNLAQFLQDILNREPPVLEGIADTLRSVLPFVEDLRPDITRELERSVYLRLTERGIEQPLVSWLLSQGTLRLVALLAVFRHPQAPSVVFIEELENGLDPRSVHVIVEEIRSFTQSGGQVVATTHSPYLLDLLDLSHIVVVERGPSGAPVFHRPSKRRLKTWAERFAPGRLYTMGSLTEG